MFKNLLGHVVLMHSNVGEGGGDRGDAVDTAAAQAAITAEEERVAKELKEKEEKDAAKKEAEKKAAKVDDVEDDDGEEDDVETDPDKKKRIPLSRHKAILETERTARAQVEAKLAQYQNGADIAKTNEEITKAEDNLLTLENKHAELVVAGETAQAAKIMADIRRTERFIVQTTASLETAAAESRAYERARYDTVVERVEEAYPELNPDDKDNFDPVKTRKVLAVSRGYQTDGMTPAKALQEAVKDLLGDPKNTKQKVAVDTKPTVDDAAAKKAAREEEARKKAADAAARQPSSGKGAGRASDAAGASLGAADVMKMSQSDFAKLDEATLARMRGDDGLPED